jgi:hypothetical protein
MNRCFPFFIRTGMLKVGIMLLYYFFIQHFDDNMDNIKLHKVSSPRL